MKNLRTTLLPFSGILLLLLCTSGYAGNKMESVEGCLLYLSNDKTKEINIVNLKYITVYRYSKTESKYMITLFYGGGFVLIDHASKRDHTLIMNAYKYC